MATKPRDPAGGSTGAEHDRRGLRGQRGAGSERARGQRPHGASRHGVGSAVTWDDGSGLRRWREELKRVRSSAWPDGA